MPAMGTSPTVVTVAMRSPLMITGNASGTSTRHNSLGARVPHRGRRLAHEVGDAVDARDDAAEQDLDRVADERDLGGQRR